jgi:hypothetical protein
MKREFVWTANATFLMLLLIFFSGCYPTKGTANVTGVAMRTGINPKDVKIYHDPPRQYETIAFVTATPRLSIASFSVQKWRDAYADELRKQAASVGASGVILHQVNGNVVYNQGFAVHVLRE